MGWREPAARYNTIESDIMEAFTENSTLSSNIMANETAVQLPVHETG